MSGWLVVGFAREHWDSFMLLVFTLTARSLYTGSQIELGGGVRVASLPGCRGASEPASQPAAPQADGRQGGPLPPSDRLRAMIWVVAARWHLQSNAHVSRAKTTRIRERDMAAAD